MSVSDDLLYFYFSSRRSSHTREHVWVDHRSWWPGWTPCRHCSPSDWPPLRWDRRSNSCRRWGEAGTGGRPVFPRDIWSRSPECGDLLSQSQPGAAAQRSAPSSSSSSSSLLHPAGGRNRPCPSPGPTHRSPPSPSSGDPPGTGWDCPRPSGRSRTRRTRTAARWGRLRSGGDSGRHLEIVRVESSLQVGSSVRGGRGGRGRGGHLTYLGPVISSVCWQSGELLTSH